MQKACFDSVAWPRLHPWCSGIVLGAVVAPNVLLGYARRRRRCRPLICLQAATPFHSRPMQHDWIWTLSYHHPSADGVDGAARCFVVVVQSMPSPHRRIQINAPARSESCRSWPDVAAACSIELSLPRSRVTATGSCLPARSRLDDSLLLRTAFPWAFDSMAPKTVPFLREQR